jgi:hypothetical protein
VVVVVVEVVVVVAEDEENQEEIKTLVARDRSVFLVLVSCVKLKLNVQIKYHSASFKSC